MFTWSSSVQRLLEPQKSIDRLLSQTQHRRGLPQHPHSGRQPRHLLAVGPYLSRPGNSINWEKVLHRAFTASAVGHGSYLKAMCVIEQYMNIPIGRDDLHPHPPRMGLES